MNEFTNIPWNNIVSFGQKSLVNTKLFTVSWILARFCNYNCSYCWPYARSSVLDHKSLDIYLSTIDEIKKQARNNGFANFHFSFSGGEPTAYKHFNKIIEHFSTDLEPSYQSLHMTTNLSPGPKWWNKWISCTSNLSRRSITASFHSEFANEDDFSEKCLYLISEGVYLTINQVMVPSMFDELYERCIRFYNKGINVTLKPQSDPTATFIVKDYTKDQIHKMQIGFPQKWKGQNLSQIELIDKDGIKYDFDQAERFNAFGFNRFSGWKCNAGYQGVVIRENQVKRSYSCKEEHLGTLEEGFKLFDEPRLCVTETCVSSADSKLPKEKIVFNKYKDE